MPAATVALANLRQMQRNLPSARLSMLPGMGTAAFRPAATLTRARQKESPGRNCATEQPLVFAAAPLTHTMATDVHPEHQE